MTRQRLWQISHTAHGLCVKCSRKAVSARFCQEHLNYSRSSNREKYRAKHGIPLDAPIKKRRPRLYP